MVIRRDRSFAGVIAWASMGNLASCQSITSNSNIMSASQESSIDAKEGQGLIKAASNFEGWEGIKTWEISSDED